MFVAMNADKVEKWVGWGLSLFSRIFGLADRKAVAHSVQGDVNAARTALVKNGPGNVIQGKLKLKFKKPEDAAVHARDGEVVVFMRKSRHREENVANAVMAYLPFAVIPRARRYVDPPTMRAVDLTVARAILQASHMPTGALDVFFDQHLDPVLAADSDLRDRLVEVDAIDLHGWLTRLMLVEFKAMGDRLHPGACDENCLRDAREFRTWLSILATRPAVKPGERPVGSLVYRGRYLSTAIVFVAMKGKIEEKGIDPYRKRTKRLIYSDRVDVVYLMARDDNIPHVKELRDSLKTDGLISEIATYEFRLRADFKARVVNRERAIIVVLRRRHVEDEPPIDPSEFEAVNEQIGDVEVYVPGVFDPAGEAEPVGVGVGTEDDEPAT